MKITLKISLKIEGIHRWEKCPIEEVSYLRDFHRHTFFIHCFIPVTHDDRDVEFIKFQHEVKEKLTEKFYDEKLKLHCFNDWSCERIAVFLLEVFGCSKVEVGEDDEFYAIVEK